MPPPQHTAAQVPRRVQDYVGEGYAKWIPDRRTICALFARIDGLDDRAPDALNRHQAIVTSLNVALRPYTGSSGTLLLDDKGLVFTLCLGMPYDTHADDVVRAVRAGLAIRSELSRVGVHCAIGIASGAGICMPLGGPERRHYWSVGRFMHVAARLMEAAGDGVLCTEEIADRVRRIASLSPERPLTLKGIRWPIRAFRVNEALLLNEHTESLYGREDEQATVDQCLAAFEQGRGTVLSIVGEAGLGKTALVEYLRQTAARRGISCLEGAAGSVEIAVAYSAWRSVFGALLDDSQSTQSDDTGQRRAQLGDIRHGQLAPLVNAVVPGFLDETPLVQSITGQARADATSTVLSEVLEARATSRFVLILEDCHWMDSASWRLALRVAQDYPEALIVLTSRPTVDVQEANALRIIPRFVELTLMPLRPDATAMLVESVLAGRPSTPALIDEVAQRSVGNPLFAREYALLLTADSHLLDPAAALESSRLLTPGPAVPVTVQSLIASRLDALSPSENLALKAASVIGDGFSVELFSSVYPGNRGDAAMDALLSRLVERQLVTRLSGDGRRFSFQHALIREVSYQQLTRDQRRDLHRRVAEAIERDNMADLSPHVAALAHHWSQAEAPEAAIQYSEKAASQALAAGAFGEADRLLGTCIRLARESGAHVEASEQIRWHRQLADARHGMGQLESRAAAAHQALRIAGLNRPHSTVALLAQAGIGLGRLTIRQASSRKLSLETDTALDVARAFRHSAEVCYFNNDMVGMICDSVNAVVHASSAPPSAVLAGAATELGGILSIAGLRRIGERILNRAIAMAEAAGDQSAQAYAHMISCLYYVGLGDWPAAERSAQRCQELCEPMDDRVNWTNAQAVRFWMSHYRSHDVEAYDAARRLRDRAAETGNRQHRAWALRCLAVCSLRRNEPAEAMTALQSALECLGETAAANERIPTLGMLALAQLRNGDVWQARATAKEGLAQIVNVRRPIGQGTLEGYSSLLTVALDAWQEERSPEWRRAILTCLGVLRRYRKGFPVGEPRYQLHAGDFQRLAGDLGAARRSYRRGEAAAVRLGMPWETRRCREALTEMSGSIRRRDP